MKIRSALLALTLAALPLAAQNAAVAPWQTLQMPTAAAVASSWTAPPAEYGPEPYYGMTGPITLDVVRRDFDTMHALGYTAVTVQYGYGAKFAYLSPEYFAFFRGVVEEAKKRGMCLWIVDDAGYPSGFAGGKISLEHPELRMQALVVEQRLPVQSGAVLNQSVSADAVSASAFSSAGEAVSVPIANGHILWTAPAGDWTVLVVAHAFRTSPTRSETNPKRVKDGSQSLEDYLDPAATAQFLSSTHEAYKAAVGAEFGKTILGFRGDEPDFSINGLPWTPKLFARFQQEKGYDVVPFLAAFLQPKETRLTPRQARAKADYYDVFARMFRDGFFKPQADWCARNGLEYQVHLNHEEAELQLVRSEGDFFRDMRYVQVPGIDTIWHQIWTDTISDFPRLASSAAHVYGHPRAFTESFAAYRPAPDLTMARYILNEQLVRGVNLVETMYFPASSNAGRGPSALMRDPAYPALMQYVRRLSYLMAMGRPAASVALLMPTSSLWFGDAVADDSFVSTERMLSEQQLDFDIVDEDAIATVLRPGAGTLQTMSGNRYTTFLVPHVSVIGQATLARLKTLAAGGGHVLFLGGTPALIAGESFLQARSSTAADFVWAQVSTVQLDRTPTPPAQPPSSPPAALVVPPALLAALKTATPIEDLTLQQADPALRYIHRELQDATVYLLFNESALSITNQVSLLGRGKTVEVWDPQSGTAKAIAGVVASHGNVTVPLRLEPYTTVVFVVR